MNPTVAFLEVRVPGAKTPPPTLSPAASTGPAVGGDGVGLPLRLDAGGGGHGGAEICCSRPRRLAGVEADWREGRHRHSGRYQRR